MKFTVNIPVTRKRTKHGYYIEAFSKGAPVRMFHLHRNKAMKSLAALVAWRTNDIRLITARDYAKKTKSKPPA